jgi:hypothetical protein
MIARGVKNAAIMRKIFKLLNYSVIYNIIQPVLQRFAEIFFDLSAKHDLYRKQFDSIPASSLEYYFPLSQC